MTPASPSWPSLRNEAWTFIPIRTSSGFTSISCDVSRTPSSISMIAMTYGFCISNWAGASWMTVYVTTVPLPPSRKRCILPIDLRPQTGQTARGGKSTFPQLPHLVPIRLYRLWISRQNRGMAISIPSLEEVDDRRGARPAQRVGKPVTRPDDLALAGLPAQLPHDLHGLRDARRPDRLAPGLQPTGRVHGDLAIQRGQPFRGGGPALAFLDEPQILDREDLGDREVVMDFGDLDVLRLETGFVERPLARDHRRVQGGQVAPVVQREEVARLARARDPDRRVVELPGLLHLAQDDGGRAIG